MYCKDIHNDLKLALYSLIKSKLIREPYLKIADSVSGKNITQMQISCHNLPIERVRYSNVVRENRLCKLCKYEIGDEDHSLMYCYHPMLSEIRNKYVCHF